MTSWAERSGRRCRAQAPVESGDVDVDIVSRTHHEGHTMTHHTTSNISSSDLEAARLLLERLGVSPEDLVGTPASKPQAPTFADYIPEVAKAVSPGTRRVYGTYWNRILEHWGERHLDEPTTLEIQQLAETIRSQVVVRRNARGGRGAAEHLIAAIRCLYNHAVADKLITEGDNPAKNATKPRRLASTRRGLGLPRLWLTLGFARCQAAEAAV